MENTVLVGLDGSTGSAGAAVWALEEAEDLGWSIVFVHTVPPVGVADPEVEASYLRRAAAQAERTAEPFLADAKAGGIPATSRVVVGAAKDVLIRLSAEAVLVVVGRRHRTGYTSRFGSVSAAMAAHSSCRTAVIPETWGTNRSTADDVPASDTGRFFDHVIAGVNESPEAHDRLAVAAEIADRHSVPLSAVTVSPNGAGQDSVPWLLDLLAPTKAKYPHLTCAAFTLTGTAAHEITEAARGARLLVIGSRGLSGIPGIIRGSVSQAVLESTSSPVLEVPSRPHPRQKRK